MKYNRPPIAPYTPRNIRSPLAGFAARFQSIVFFLIPIMYVIQNPTFQRYDEIESGIKLYHLFAIALFAVSAYRASLKAIVMFLLFTSLAISATFFSDTAEVNTRFLNAGGFAMMFLGAAGAGAADRRYARNGAMVAAILLAVTTLWQLPTIISTAAANIEGRALYPTLMAGGINIQASTFAILYVWAVGGQLVSTGGAILVAFMLTQTRSIFLVFPAIFADQLGRKGSSQHFVRNLIAFIAFGVVLAGMLYLNIIDISKLINRIYAIFSGDAGTQGRLLLYQVALSHTECYLTGCGFGSAADLIAGANYSSLYEDNFHNIYVQTIVEMGIFGLLLYVYLLTSSYLQARSRLKDRGLGIAILATAIMGLVEFNGLDFLTAFLIGLGFSRVAHASDHHRLRKSR